MQKDRDVRGMMISCEDKCFSKGTDYRSTSHAALAYSYLQQKDPEHSYLSQVQRFMYSMSKMEKPILTVMDGKTYGSAAVFGMLGHFPMTTPNTSVCFPETGFGFVPTGGASYFLSRLPDHLGTFLALTGDRLNGSDLVALKQAVGHVETGRLLDTSLSTFCDFMPTQFGTRRFFGDYWTLYNTSKVTMPLVKLAGDICELQNRTNMHKNSGYWKRQRENFRMVLADVIYRQLLEKDTQEDTMVNYKEFKGQPVINHLLNFESACVDRIERTRQNAFSHEKYMPAMFRCFSAPNFDEVWKRLELETKIGETEWANYTIERLKARSPLALAVTFKLVKDAAHLQWHECLEREFTAAANLASHADFHAGVTTLLRTGAQPTWKSQWPVSQQQIDDICNGPKLDLKAKDHELLPTTHYFRTIPAAPRLWMNELSAPQEYIREDYDFDVQHFFNGMDIDVRNSMITQELVRKVMYHSCFAQYRIKAEIGRLKSVSRDETSRRVFLTERDELIREYFANETEAKEKIRQLLAEGYRDAIRARMELAQTKSEEAHRLEKNKFFKELKGFVASEKLTLTESEKDSLDQLEESFNGLMLPMNFPVGDNKSYLDEVKSKFTATIPPHTYFSLLEYKQYLLAGLESNDEVTECQELLVDSLLRMENNLLSIVQEMHSRENPVIIPSTNSEPALLLNTDVTVDEYIDSKLGETKPKDQFKEVQDEAIDEAVNQYYTDLLMQKSEHDEAAAWMMETLQEVEQTAQNDDYEEDFKDDSSRLTMAEIFDQSKEPGEGSATMAMAKINERRAMEHKRRLYRGLLDSDDSEEEGYNSEEEVPPEEAAAQAYKALQGMEKGDAEFDEEKKWFVPELQAELYVKFGVSSVQAAVEMLKSKRRVDLAGMKARRREVLNNSLKFKASVPHPSPQLQRLKKMFTELYITPDDSEVNDLLASKLELESSRAVIENVLGKRYLRKRSTDVHSWEYEESEEEPPELADPHPESVMDLGKDEDEEDEPENEEKEPRTAAEEDLRSRKLEMLEEESDAEGEEIIDFPTGTDEKLAVDVPSSVLLDHIYLGAVFGDRSYLPEKWTGSYKDAPQEIVQLGNLSELPQDWLKRTLKETVTELLQQRAAVEKYLTRSELISYDQTFFKKFTVENFKKEVQRRLYTEVSFLRDVSADAMEIHGVEDHKVASMFGFPGVKKQDVNDLAENEAIKYAIERKQLREEGKPKEPPQFSVEDEVAYAEVLAAERKAGYPSQLSEKELKKLSQPPPNLPVQAEQNKYRDRKHQVKAKEQRLLDNQETIAALKILIKEKKYRDRLRDPEAVEAFLKEREQSLA